MKHPSGRKRRSLIRSVIAAGTALGTAVTFAACGGNGLGPITGTWENPQASSSGFRLQLVIHDDGIIGGNGGWGGCAGKAEPKGTAYRLTLDCGTIKTTAQANLAGSGQMLVISWPDSTTERLRRISRGSVTRTVFPASSVSRFRRPASGHRM